MRGMHTNLCVAVVLCGCVHVCARLHACFCVQLVCAYVCACLCSPINFDCLLFLQLVSLPLCSSARHSILESVCSLARSPGAELALVQGQNAAELAFMRGRNAALPCMLELMIWPAPGNAPNDSVSLQPLLHVPANRSVPLHRIALS